MKPLLRHVALVTASVDPVRAEECFRSWVDHAAHEIPTYVVVTDFPGEPVDRTAQKAQHDVLARVFSTEARRYGDILFNNTASGTVPAFAAGVQAALGDPGIELVVCLHDDVVIYERDWDVAMLRPFAAQRVGTPIFAGFGGAVALGDIDIYRSEYRPEQLARQGFASNLVDAENHGTRTTIVQPAVVFDGFSQIGSRSWFGDAWRWLGRSGIVHHAYDAALGCLAARAKVPGTLIPISCRHLGGRTAVGSEAYHRWANEQTKAPDGDQTFWKAAHRIVYQEFRDVLPIRLPRGEQR